MTVLGLPLIDVWIVGAVLMAITVAGLIASRRSAHPKRQSDFFVAGRKLGSLLQFFLTFGYMADANEAAVVATEVYRQGTPGMWIGFQALFLTPFFWFTPVWFRRTRQITFADLFKDRFDSNALAMFYAVINILTLSLMLALGHLVAYKFTSAMMVKPPSEYTAAEQLRVNRFNQYEALKAKYNEGRLTTGEEERYRELDSMWAHGEISSSVSYVRPEMFYLAYSLIVGSYLLLGGMKAVAIIDGFQSFLILAISFLLLPFGLAKIGGIGALHSMVPAYMFRIFGDGELSEYNWVTILGIVLASLVGTPSTGGPGNASGKNERAIRTGTLSGAFAKRLVMIAWMFCGLMAVALFGPRLSDPDSAWGAMSSTLLVPGFMGVMIAGMLVGHMPALSYTCLTVSALFTRNVYEPVRPGKTQGHYLVVAKLSIVAALVLAALLATFFTGAIALLTTAMTFMAFAGATGYLIYFWRRLTTAAIWIGTIFWILFIGVLPWGLPQFEGFRREPSLLLRGAAVAMEQPAQREVPAVPAEGMEAVAERGEAPPRSVPLFFDKLARIRPSDPASPLEGIGRFNIENYVLYRCGVPLQTFRPAGVVACRWYLDAALPFVLLISLSYLPLGRSPEQEKRNQLFFAKLRTPIGRSREEDEAELARNEREPGRFEGEKLFPGSEWEFSKWTRADVLGFVGCWGLVGGILVLLKLLLMAR